MVHTWHLLYICISFREHKGKRNRMLDSKTLSLGVVTYFSSSHQVKCKSPESYLTVTVNVGS